MNRRNVFQTLLASLAIPFAWPWPNKSSTLVSPKGRKPLRVTCTANGYWSCVEVRDDKGKLTGHFEIRYDLKTQELIFALASEDDREISCLIDAYYPITWDEVANPITAKASKNGIYRIRMT